MQKKILDNRYELERKIGEGGMARIYVGLDRRLNRRVAIKIPHSHFLNEPDFLSRFRHEAQAAAMLAHPNIVDIFDVGQDGDVHYIVMEYVDGTDLKSIINREAPLTIDRAVNLAEQIARGLHAAHRAGMVHRDVKPQNVIVTPDGRAHVTDFGVAKSHLSTAMTETGIAFGTVDYLSPEQAQGRPATPRSDVYALGILLYELLTGRLPFKGENAVAVAMKHVNEAPTPPRHLNPSIPLGLEALVLRALEKDPSRRPQDAAEFARLLNDYDQLASQATVVNQAMPRPIPQPRAPAPSGPIRPSAGGGATGRMPIAPRPGPARAPRQEGLGCGVFLVGMFILASVLAVVFAFSTGLFGDLFAGIGGGGTGGGVTPTQPTASPTPDDPTHTPEPTRVTVSVPELSGMSGQVAETTLRQLQLRPVRLEAHDQQVAINQVISQAVAPGTALEPGSNVTYTVSLGPRVIEVLDVGRLQAELAEQRLRGAGFAVEVVNEPSGSVDRGFVIRQQPSPGLRVSEGQLVTIFVSMGDVVRFPEVIGLQRDQAEQVLERTPGLTLVYVDLQGRDRLIDYDRFRDNEVVSAQIENGPAVLNGDWIARGSRIIFGIKAPEQ
ncbi:Stk1 family PASTA domain-containing Ser/Thr kinase [Candidatus Viridilinea mediisalina]|uniref:non-specific serine/threonine protein kinase n=1 Tax=Candidatus Viridilinea mediisalina TaxID=2024553 RepID=A0A2A6RNM2_9CHLR|nr:Stk1 family PASTA domain-containing Ser/Thr kinase [Candidatus Viridilinea mediisalina]PDW04647.1 protein kinase [Candidatus Viridilinea mediisalina]